MSETPSRKYTFKPEHKNHFSLLAAHYAGQTEEQCIDMLVKEVEDLMRIIGARVEADGKAWLAKQVPPTPPATSLSE